MPTLSVYDVIHKYLFKLKGKQIIFRYVLIFRPNTYLFYLETFFSICFSFADIVAQSRLPTLRRKERHCEVMLFIIQANIIHSSPRTFY